jgi:hypothetical protein
MVSLRLSWAVNPFAAQDATPRLPLPNGMNWLELVLACWSTMSERRTTLAVSVTNVPLCHAVVVPAGGGDEGGGDAGGVEGGVLVPCRHC